MPTPADVQKQVDAFLMSLPLGTSRADAEVEDAVAAAMTAALLSTADAVSRLNEASARAGELQRLSESQARALAAAGEGEIGLVRGGGVEECAGCAAAADEVADLRRALEEQRRSYGDDEERRRRGVAAGGMGNFVAAAKDEDEEEEETRMIAALEISPATFWKPG